MNEREAEKESLREVGRKMGPVWVLQVQDSPGLFILYALMILFDALDKGTHMTE